MNLLRNQHILGFFLLFFVGANSRAQNYILKGDYYLRSSSTDLISDSTRLGVLHKNSTFRVVKSIPTARGEALEIEVTSKAPGSYWRESDRVYIYRSKNDPLIVNRDVKSQTSEAAAAKCENCNGDTMQSQNAAASENRISIGMVADKITRAANEAPKSNVVPVEVKPLLGPAREGSLDDAIDKYSKSDEVNRMIDWAMKNKSRSSRGKCYRSVKEAMATKFGAHNKFKGPGNNLTKFPSTDIKDFYALSAKTRLKEQGFVNLLETEPYKSEMRSPSQAPKGAILVYSSGIPCNATRTDNKTGAVTVIARTKDCGHTEIKTGEPGKPGFVSDYYSADAINETGGAKKNGTSYKLVGVMIKPKE